MSLGPDAILAAMKVNIGDPDDFLEKADNMKIPGLANIPPETLRALKTKYGLLGQVAAYRKFLKFVTRVEGQMDEISKKQDEKNAAKKAREGEEQGLEQGLDQQLAGKIPGAGGEEPQRLAAGKDPDGNAISDGQYKHSSAFHLRNQSSFPSSFGPTKSFGGVQYKTKGKKAKLKEADVDKLLSSLFEDMTEDMKFDDGVNSINAEEGTIYTNGNLTVENHADALRVLVDWLVDNRAEVLQSFLAGFASNVSSGASFE